MFSVFEQSCFRFCCILSSSFRGFLHWLHRATSMEYYRCLPSWAGPHHLVLKRSKRAFPPDCLKVVAFEKKGLTREMSSIRFAVELLNTQARVLEAW